MIVNGSAAVSILQSTGSSAGGVNYGAALSNAQGTSAHSAGDMTAALKQADKNETQQLAQTRKDPQVKRALARFERVVKNAKSIDDVLNDPLARQVFMKANGLGDQVTNVGLAKKALGGDYTATNSVAKQLSATNAQWLDTAEKYSFHIRGIGALQTSDAIKEVEDNYVGEVRLDNLDQQLPGLGTALLFKKNAKNYSNSLKVLGSRLGREVITTAFNIPSSIAVQSVEAQMKAVDAKVKFSKMSDPNYVDRIVQRYLANVNGVSTGVSA